MTAHGHAGIAVRRIATDRSATRRTGSRRSVDRRSIAGELIGLVGWLVIGGGTMPGAAARMLPAAAIG